MKAMRLMAGRSALRRETLEIPRAGAGQVLIEVSACGVCRTDLHLVDGELPLCRRPIIPGHEVVGTVVEGGSRFAPGARIGVPWLGWTCGECGYCRSGRENLCERARFTGCHLDGGYADYVVADERFCLPVPERYGDAEAAPLLCAGLIGYRCYAKCEDASIIGLYGFGAAAHLVAQAARQLGREVYAFTRAGDAAGQAFARELGATWAGDSDERPPVALDAAIIFAPVGALVPLALAAVRKGGRVVCGGIHMSDIPAFPYRLLWEERELCSVANLTRADAAEFFAFVAKAPLRVETVSYPLERANAALDDLRGGRVQGAAVLVP